MRKQYPDWHALHSEYKKKWWEENKDRLSQNKRDLREVNEDYRLQDLERCRMWAMNNKDKANAIKQRWLENNPEKRKLASKKWAQNNPEKVWAYAARHRKTDLCRATKRRLQMKRRGGEATKATLKKVLNTNFLQFGLTCCENCHTSIRDRYEFDHIIPIALGGNGDYDNLQVLCKPCNIEKMTNAIDFRRFIREIC